MKTKKINTAIILALTSITLFTSCDKEKDPDPLKVLSMVTNQGVALDTTTPVTDIPVNAFVVITFDKEINLETVNANSVSLAADDIAVPATLSLVAATLTITPTIDLALGTVHTISITQDLQATDGAPAEIAKYDFKTFGRANVVPPQSASQLSYFPFSGNLRDVVGAHTPVPADVRNMEFAKDRFGFDGMAGLFNGSTSIVEIPGGEQYMMYKSLTLSVWIKSDSTKSGQYVLGLAAWKGFQLELSQDWAWVKFATHFAEANGIFSSEDNWFPGTGDTKDNGGWQGWTFHKDVLPHNGGVGKTYFKSKWAHVVCTYESSSKLATMYINGEKVKQHDFNLWPVNDPKRTISGVSFGGNFTGGGNKLALGFIQGSQNRIVNDTWADPADIYSNHFKGAMDDVRFFKVALTASEVAELYNAEKP